MVYAGVKCDLCDNSMIGVVTNIGTSMEVILACSDCVTEMNADNKYLEKETITTYTNCEDYLPHDEHEIGGDVICIGKSYGPPPMREDYDGSFQTSP